MPVWTGMRERAARPITLALVALLLVGVWALLLFRSRPSPTPGLPSTGIAAVGPLQLRCSPCAAPHRELRDGQQRSGSGNVEVLTLILLR